jgi:hypothetical protein
MTLTNKEKKARREQRAEGRTAIAAEEAKYGAARYQAMCDLQQHLFRAFHLMCDIGAGPILPSLREEITRTTFYLQTFERENYRP